MKTWNKFECKDGSTYEWKWDDGRICIKVGESQIWMNLQILQFLAAESYVKIVGKEKSK